MEAISTRNNADRHALDTKNHKLARIQRGVQNGFYTAAEAETARNIAESIYRTGIIMNANQAELTRRQIAIDQRNRDASCHERADLEDIANDSTRDAKLQESFADYLICDQRY